MKRRCFLVDPGHGGKFTGAVCDGIAEKDINLSVAYKIYEEFEMRGIHCAMTRTVDDCFSESLGDDLQERCNIEHILDPALTISVHCNKFHDQNAHGFEIWTSPGETESDLYAISIFNAVKDALPERRYRKDVSDGDPDKESKFKVLTGTKGAAVLVELEFMSNEEGLKWLVDENQQRVIAKAICDGAINGLGEIES